MDSESWTWHWGTFLVYCVACFFAAMAMGCMGVPGIIIVIVGAAVGLWAALRRWFEIPVVPRNIFTDCDPGGRR
jgi:hypothetical protein